MPLTTAQAIATLNFQKSKVALNPMYRIILFKLCQKLHLILLIKILL